MTQLFRSNPRHQLFRPWILWSSQDGNMTNGHVPIHQNPLVLDTFVVPGRKTTSQVL
jgi:hypothetical protein